MQVSSKSLYTTAVILLLTLMIVSLIVRRGVPMVVETNLQKIPMKIGDYRGISDSFPDSVYRALNADQYVYRHYRNEKGNQVDLYIGYYGTAKGGRTGHNPYACFPSAGWAIIETGEMDLEHAEGKATVNLMVVQKGGAYETVLHWYQSDKNKILSTGIQQNIQRLISRIRSNRNDGAFVRVSMLTDRDGIEKASLQTEQFAEKLLAIIPEYWPVER